jgi:hypothetical protein
MNWLSIIKAMLAVLIVLSLSLLQSESQWTGVKCKVDNNDKDCPSGTKCVKAMCVYKNKST